MKRLTLFFDKGKLFVPSYMKDKELLALLLPLWYYWYDARVKSR